MTLMPGEESLSAIVPQLNGVLTWFLAVLWIFLGVDIGCMDMGLPPKSCSNQHSGRH